MIIMKIQNSEAISTVQMPNGGESVESETPQNLLLTSVPYAEVMIDLGITKNLGHYESLRISVSLKKPCADTPEALDRAYADSTQWVEDKLASLLSKAMETLKGSK